MIPLQAYPNGLRKPSSDPKSKGEPLFALGYEVEKGVMLRDVRFSPSVDAWEANWLLHNAQREGEFVKLPAVKQARGR